MIVALVALNVALCVATQIVASRRESRLLTAALARTPGEYVAMRRAEVTPHVAKKVAQPEHLDVDPADLTPIGL